MAQILVGLLDYDSLHIRSNAKDRLAHVAEAVEKTREEALKHQLTAATGKLKSIFVAPEFLFIREQKGGRAVTYDQRKEILTALEQISIKSPSMLMIPG